MAQESFARLPIMELPESAVLKIQKFVQNRQAAEKESAHEPLSATALHAYARRLDGTLLQLQEQVRQQEEDLRKVCETLWPFYTMRNWKLIWPRL